MKRRIQQLEHQLSKLTQDAAQVLVQTSDSHIEKTTSGTGGSFTVHQKRRSFGQAEIVRHILYKTRLCGRSHWMNGAIQVSSRVILWLFCTEALTSISFRMNSR